MPSLTAEGAVRRTKGTPARVELSFWARAQKDAGHEGACAARGVRHDLLRAAGE